MEQLDLKCEPFWRIGLIGTVFQLGQVATLPWASRIADIFGRKPICMVALIAHLIVYMLMLYTTQVQTMIYISFISGSFYSIVNAIGYIYMVEMM